MDDEAVQSNIKMRKKVRKARREEEGRGEKAEDNLSDLHCYRKI